MAIENAKKFVEKVKADAALCERVKDMTPQEGLALAKELGLEFTEAELKDALNNRELNPEELDEAAGGAGRRHKNPTNKECNDKQHNWVKTGHYEDPRSFLWIDYTWGYDVYTCSNCGKTMEKHV